jgi:hypothetical protein
MTTIEKVFCSSIFPSFEILTNIDHPLWRCVHNLTRPSAVHLLTVQKIQYWSLIVVRNWESGLGCKLKGKSVEFSKRGKEVTQVICRGAPTATSAKTTFRSINLPTNNKTDREPLSGKTRLVTSFVKFWWAFAKSVRIRHAFCCRRKSQKIRALFSGYGSTFGSGLWIWQIIGFEFLRVGSGIYNQVDL